MLLGNTDLNGNVYIKLVYVNLMPLWVDTPAHIVHVDKSNLKKPACTTHNRLIFQECFSYR